MENLYYLPSEFYYLLSKLPDVYRNILEMHKDTINQMNLKQLSQEIGSQLLHYYQRNPSVLQNHAFVNSICFVLYVSENYDKLQELTSSLDNLYLLIWNFIVTNSVKRSIVIGYNQELPILSSQSDLERLILDIINSISSSNFDTVTTLHLIDDFVKTKENLVANHLITFNMFFHTLGFNLFPINKRLSLINLILHTLENFNFKFLMMLFYEDIGGCYQMQMNDLSLDYYNRSLEISETNDFDNQFVIRNNIAVNEIQKGNYKRAEYLYRKLIEDHGVQYPYIVNLAESFYMRMQYKKALGTFNQYNDSIGFDTVMDPNAFVQKVLLDQNKTDEAKQYLERAKEILDKEPNLLNKSQYQLMKARQFYAEGRLDQSLHIYDILIEISLKLQLLMYTFKISFEKIEKQIEYIEIKNQKYSKFTKPNLLTDIDSLIQLAKEQEVHIYLIEGLRLRGKVLINEQQQEAKEDYQLATKLAKKYNFDQLETQLQQENEELFNTEEVLKDQSFWHSVTNRIKQFLSINIGGIYTKIDYQFHGVLVISNNGTPIYNRYVTDQLQSDPALASSLITAVSSFMNELIQSQGYLQSIQHDDMTLIMEPTQNFVSIAIVSKETYGNRRNLRKFVNVLQKEFGMYDLVDDFHTIPGQLFTELNKITEKIFEIE